VPDRAQTHVTARTALDCDLQKLRTRLESSENWPEAEIFPIIYRGESYTGRKSNWPSDHPAWETPVDSDFFQTLQNLYLQVLKREAQHKIWPFSTDGVYSAGMEKIPTLGLGPGLESCAHIVDEWVSEEQLLEALQIYSCLPFAL
jgi:acetylornithine deacetylase/succinyl-diaminopimelate desuccinylase-like protein